MIRTVTLAAALVLAAPAAAQTLRAAPVLKGEVTVVGDLVRIGDFIDNAGPAASIAIFRAPDPGETGSVPARRVIEAARVHNVVGVDTRGLDEVSVTRVSRAISAKDIEARVSRALAGTQIDPKDLLLTFDTELRALQVAPTASGELQVSRLAHDPRTGRFDVTLEFPATDGVRRVPLRLTGTAVETAEVPVLARPLARGETVKASDVAVERRPKAELGGDAITASAAAVGRAARRALRPGVVLRQADLMKPELVQRNETVTIVYEAPGMLLTIRGKALEAGAEGDLINVANIQSKRHVQATVTGPGLVTVARARNSFASAATAGAGQPE